MNKRELSKGYIQNLIAWINECTEEEELEEIFDILEDDLSRGIISTKLYNWFISELNNRMTEIILGRL